MRTIIIAMVAFVAACTDAKTEVDPGATAVEVTTTIDPSLNITQLRLTGLGSNGQLAFMPGLVPDQPRALSGDQTAMILLPDDAATLDVRVEGLAGDTVVAAGAVQVAVEIHAVTPATVTLGPPPVCGDGIVDAPFEGCDDGNAAASDGCSPDCIVDPNYACHGTSPSVCLPTSAKEITGFVFRAADNPALSADVIATITDNTSAIHAVLPDGIDITNLVATFDTTGASVTVGSSTEVSGTTVNDFTTSVTYHVIAVDGSTRDYTVTAVVAGREITTFSFLRSTNPALTNDLVGSIVGNSIVMIAPFGTNVSGLVATFTTTGDTVSIGSNPQASGITSNNFASMVTYRVTAIDGSTRDYNVLVQVASSSAKELTFLAFAAADNPGLAQDITGTISDTTISAVVPAGTNVTGLISRFTTTGTSVTVNSVMQISGQTPNDFTNPVIYHVTAADSSSQDYTITVTVAASSSKSITSFGFFTASNPGLGADVPATINGTSITAVVPAGTNLASLVATFAITGMSVTVNGTAQVSGTTSNNFTSPVTYHVTAADASAQDFTVTVTEAAGSAKDITAFEFESTHNAGFGQSVIGVINGTTITLNVKANTDVTALVATFTTTGASVSVGGVTQTSTVTPNNFTNPVTYRVTAADGSTKDYSVVVSVANTSAKDITAFSFLSVNNPNLTADAIGTINGTGISVALPAGTDVTALVATFSTTGNSVKIGNKVQVSGVTANNFTSSVVYKVTAADNSSKNFTVTVTH